MSDHATTFPRRQAGLAVILVLIVSGLAACAHIGGARIARIGDRRVEYALAGQGTPAVVLENGLGARLDWWAKVFPEVARETRVYAYNRAGTGDSDVASTPRDGNHIVEELRQNLRASGIAPPYVLVGHSLGGLYMQLYARRHPDEVAGLVLVDSTHPLQMQGAGGRDNWPAWANVAFDAITSDAAKQELVALPATGAELLALPPLRGKPVIVLSAQKPMAETSTLARDANAKRIDILRLNPGASRVWVDSGHDIPLEQPQAVVAAIHEVLAQARRQMATHGAR